MTGFKYPASSISSFAGQAGGGGIPGAFNYDITGSLDFNEVNNEHVNTNIAPNIGTGDFAISAWAKPQYDLSSGGERTIVSTYNGTGIIFAIEGGGIRFFTDGNDLTPVSLDQLSQGVFSHVLAQKRSGTKELYINGLKVPSTQSDTNDLSDGGDYRIASRASGAGGSPFEGIITDVLIYEGRSFSPVEVKLLKSRLLADTTKDAVGFYKFASGSGSTLVNEVGTDGTLVNSPTWSSDIPNFG